MFHLLYLLEEGELSEAVCYENRRFSTALKLQVVLVSLLVAFAAALFCLPAKNAYALMPDPDLKVVTIDGVTYSYVPLSGGGVEIRKIESDVVTSVIVPDKINDAYVCRLAELVSYSETNCEIDPSIKSLDISKCSHLEMFHSDEDTNSLVSLNASGNTSISDIWCNSRDLVSLNVLGCIGLEQLVCSHSELTFLDLSGLVNLECLDCNSNRLTSLDVSGCIKLQEIWCFNNSLSEIDTTGLSALKSLYCYSNKISNTAALEAWLAQDGHEGQVLPQKASEDQGNTGNSGNAGNAGNNGDNNTPATLTGTWKHNSKGWWYAYSNGTYAKGMKKIGNATYYFDSKGWMKTGWQHATGNSDWYYFNKSGAMKTGWLKSGGKWYYLNPTDGKMKTGFYNVGNTRYYSNGSGVMKTGWQKISNSWYYFASSGAMKIGWAKTGGKWYYLNSEGKMQTGKQVISGKTYFLNSSGAMRTGWIKDGSAWRYANKSGAMQTSKWIGNYYVDANGTMLTNQWVKTNGKEYYVNKAGKWTGAKR